jgi:hypothetical protein
MAVSSTSLDAGRGANYLRRLGGQFERRGRTKDCRRTNTATSSTRLSAMSACASWRPKRGRCTLQSFDAPASGSQTLTVKVAASTRRELACRRAGL